MVRKFKCIKEVPATEKGWEDFGTIPLGTICEAPCWHGFETIDYHGKKVCDIDSDMAKEYFKEIS